MYQGKVLISSCLLGNKVRWNGKDKFNKSLSVWAEQNGIELVPVCPEDELLGTPRAPIRLIQIEDKIEASYKGEDIASKLRQKSEEIFERHPEALGFIGIHGSPSCGVAVGVKNLGRVTKGYMHLATNKPTTQSNFLKSEKQREQFLKRLEKIWNQ